MRVNLISRTSKNWVSAICLLLLPSVSGCVPISGSLVTAPLSLLMGNPLDRFQTEQLKSFDKTSTFEEVEAGPISVEELLAQARETALENADRATPDEASIRPLLLAFDPTRYSATADHIAQIGRYVSSLGYLASEVKVSAGPAEDADEMNGMLSGMRRAKSVERILEEIGVAHETSFDPNAPRDSIAIIPILNFVEDGHA